MKNSLVVLLFLLGWSVTAEQRLAIVVSPQSEITVMDGKALQAVFLGLLTQDVSLRQLKPVDLHDGDERDFFYQYLVGRNRNQMKAYWTRMHFTGRGKSPSEISVDTLSALLDSNPSVIAYIPKQMVDSRFKVILEIP
jgi:hypothetical protein